jgi:hypothetical protein
MIEQSSEEFVAINGTDLIKVFLSLSSVLNRQILEKIESPLMAEVDEKNVGPMAAVFRIRRTLANKDAEAQSRIDQAVKTFLDGKSRDLGFAIYASAPNCFRSPGMMAFVKHLRKLQTVVKAKFYLKLIQANHKKSGKTITDLTELRIEEPTTVREQFYSRATDGWYSQYDVKVEGNHVILRSSGPDRKIGTEDDFIAAEGPLDDET